MPTAIVKKIAPIKLDGLDSTAKQYIKNFESKLILKQKQVKQSGIRIMWKLVFFLPLMAMTAYIVIKGSEEEKAELRAKL